MTVTIESTCISLSPSALKDALTAALLSASKDDTVLPVLNAVQVEKAGKELILRSTDRYRATRVTVTLDSSGGDAPDWIVLIQAADVKHLVTALPKPARRGLDEPVGLSVEDDSLTVETGQATLRVKSLDMDFPKVDGIVPTSVGAIDGIGLNPKYLIDLSKMPGRRKDEPVRFKFFGESKPTVAEWTDETNGVSYLHMLMPTRIDS